MLDWARARYNLIKLVDCESVICAWLQCVDCVRAGCAMHACMYVCLALDCMKLRQIGTGQEESNDVVVCMILGYLDTIDISPCI